MDADFSNQVAAITGAGQGIGRTIALRLARQGADVAIAEINEESLEEVRREIEDEGVKCFTGEPTDVTDPDQVEEWMGNLVDTMGSVDVLVNNAGIAEAAPITEVSNDTWHRHIDVLLHGTFYFTRQAAPHMVEQEYGRIVNIASVGGLMGTVGLSPYSTAKSGVIGFTRAVATELGGEGVTVNAVAPGPIRTPLLEEAWDEEALRDRGLHTPVGRLGETEEIADAAAFLASPDAEYINGETLVVDGGSVAAGSYMVEVYRKRKKAEGKL